MDSTAAIEFWPTTVYFMCEGLTAVSSTSAQSSITVFQNSQLWTAEICSAVVTWLLPAG